MGFWVVGCCGHIAEGPGGGVVGTGAMAGPGVGNGGGAVYYDPSQ